MLLTISALFVDQRGKINLCPCCKYEDAEQIDESAQTLTDVSAWLERIRLIRETVPDEDWGALPADLAENFDAYLYSGRDFPE